LLNKVSLFELLSEFRNHLEQIINDAVVSNLENCCFRVFVDRYYDF